MIIPKSRLIYNISQELSDNSTGQISPRDIRHNLIDIIDSVHLFTEDSNIEALNIGTPETRSVKLGKLSLDSLKLDGYTSTDNVAIGYSTLKSSFQTRRNTALGSYALSCNIHGDGNLALGYSSLAGNTTGYSNVGIGTHSLNANKRGHFNIGIGNAAGYYIGPDDSFKFYLASHPVDESYICDNPHGSGLTPLLYGDLEKNYLGINTKKLHNNSVLQTSGNISPSVDNVFSLGLNSYRWNKLFTTNILNHSTSIQLTDSELILNANSNIYLDTSDIIIGGNLSPDQPSLHNIGSVYNRFNIGYFEQLFTNFFTALQKSFFSHKTLYLASSGEWSIDGGGPSSLYEYYPCTNSLDIVPILTDAEIDGGGLVLQSTSNQYNFIFKSTPNSCDTYQRWYSNIGLELSGINSHITAPAFISSESDFCKGIFMSGEQIFISNKDIYLSNSNIAGNGHINFYAPSVPTNINEYIISYITIDSGVDISQRFLASEYPKNIINNKEKLTGFETKFFNDNQNSRLVIRSYLDDINANKHLILMSNTAGTLGVNNFNLNGDELYPETIFNIRSINDAIVRVTAENDTDSYSAIQLLAPQNCLNSGLEIFYQNNSGILGLNVYDDSNKYPILYSNKGSYLGIYATSGTQDLITIGSSEYFNTSIALYQSKYTPSKSNLYGKLYVTDKNITNQSQTLNFLDDEGNNFDLILNRYSVYDGLIYSNNGNTFGGICPDIRGDTPDAINNTVYGYHALNNIINGYCNTMYGYNAGSSITSGFNNVGIGCNSFINSNSDITNNIAIGCDGIGTGLQTNYNFLLGSSSNNLLFKGILGPSNADKHLFMPDGKLTLLGQYETDSLYLDSHKILVQDHSGLDYPEHDFKIQFAGNSTSDLMVLNHNSQPFNTLYLYHAFNPPRPFVEVHGDVRVKGAVAFRDGSYIESAKILTDIIPIINQLEDIFIEGVALEDIELANNIESPTSGIIKLRDSRNIRIINRDIYTKIKKGDYIIAIKISGEYRPIWISNASSVCTCCTK